MSELMGHPDIESIFFGQACFSRIMRMRANERGSTVANVTVMSRMKKPSLNVAVKELRSEWRKKITEMPRGCRKNDTMGPIR